MQGLGAQVSHWPPPSVSLAWAGHWDTRGSSGPVMQEEQTRLCWSQPLYRTHLALAPRKYVNSEQESREKQAAYKPGQ